MIWNQYTVKNILDTFSVKSETLSFHYFWKLGTCTTFDLKYEKIKDKNILDTFSVESENLSFH